MPPLFLFQTFSCFIFFNTKHKYPSIQHLKTKNKVKIEPKTQINTPKYKLTLFFKGYTLKYIYEYIKIQLPKINITHYFDLIFGN